MKLIITDTANADIVKGIKWYNKKLKNLGYKFADYIYACFEEIGKRPFGYANKYKYTREMFVKKYPYVIIYTVEEDFIFIIKVFPCRTNPLKKYRSLKRK